MNKYKILIFNIVIPILQIGTFYLIHGILDNIISPVLQDITGLILLNKMLFCISFLLLFIGFICLSKINKKKNYLWIQIPIFLFHLFLLLGYLLQTTKLDYIN